MAIARYGDGAGKRRGSLGIEDRPGDAGEQELAEGIGGHGDS